MKPETVIDNCLKEMFKRVGEKYPNKELTDSEDWYMQKNWTEEKQEEFRIWMVKYLIKTGKRPRKQAIIEASYFLLQWGWTTRDKMSDMMKVIKK